jgi:hypothetical protein
MNRSSITAQAATNVKDDVDTTAAAKQRAKLFQSPDLDWWRSKGIRNSNK